MLKGDQDQMAFALRALTATLLSIGEIDHPLPPYCSQTRPLSLLEVVAKHLHTISGNESNPRYHCLSNYFLALWYASRGETHRLFLPRITIMRKKLLAIFHVV